MPTPTPSTPTQTPSANNPYNVPDFAPPAPNSKLTPGFIKRLAAGIGTLALWPVEAARQAGIHGDTFKDWKKQGRLDREAEIESPYTIMLDTMEMAEIDAEQWLASRAMSAAAHDGRLALEILARRFPERWGRKDRAQAVTTGDALGEIANFLQVIQNNHVTIHLPAPVSNAGYAPPGGSPALPSAEVVELDAALGGTTPMVALGTQGEEWNLWETLGEE